MRDLSREEVDFCVVGAGAGGGVGGEILPQQQNMVKLHETERDRYGLPGPHVRFGYHEKDRRIINHSVAKMGEMLEAAGG